MQGLRSLAKKTITTDGLKPLVNGEFMKKLILSLALVTMSFTVFSQINESNESNELRIRIVAAKLYGAPEKVIASTDDFVGYKKVMKFLNRSDRQENYFDKGYISSLEQVLNDPQFILTLNKKIEQYSKICSCNQTAILPENRLTYTILVYPNPNTKGEYESFGGYIAAMGKDSLDVNASAFIFSKSDMEQNLFEASLMKKALTEKLQTVKQRAINNCVPGVE